MNLLEMVDRTLSVFPETCNSDVELVTKLWVTYYPNQIRKGSNGELGIYLKDLWEVPSASAIERYRRKLNEDGKHLPTDPNVLKARGLMEDEWKENLGYSKHEE